MTSLPETMTVIAIKEPGGPEVLQPDTRPVPAPGPGEVLVKVMAAGVNRPDVLQRSGAYPPPKGTTDLPGLEVSGIIAAVGEGTQRWSVGDKVVALTPGGGYAEYALVDGRNVLPLPGDLDWVTAAALPETFFTVWHNVFQRGGLKAGETLLIHGGSSGIGTTAIMLAKAFGARVFTTAGSDEKCEACRKLGADLAINYKTQNWLEEVRNATDKKGVELILDMVGGPYIEQNYVAAANDGRIVNIAFLMGSKVEIDFTRLMMKRLIQTGSTLRAQSVAAKAKIAAELEEKVWPLVAAGTVKPVIHAVFPLAEAAKAHALMETSSHIGKIVMTVGAEA
ncbi:Beta-ketoacyl-acyl-carrier-protein synthase I [Hartmannibacter diazotrophicus]|uniref:Beta-ketoacyl-acyl-carrier-protein synthase I n=1 Tax=Hartmannibacter diazotrophicus TaxID=1482074 RepID=A0A2C9DDJ2_9HYPH|nr:NAD(P)H-quinone oxidoreductase [Hartmannibacter diazotrophicus]SON57685.1 Beta-ketoacyl-acyl-carrier-protein synthase I [Hartmannibacter diazotrophicus]